MVKAWFEWNIRIVCMACAITAMHTDSMVHPVAAQTNDVAIGFDKPMLMEKSDPPALPRSLLRSNARGIALVRVSVTATGTTELVELVRSTGMKPLDAFLVQWVTSWRFLPKLQDNRTTDGFTILSIRYDLADNRFEAPPVNELTMTLPEPFQILWQADPQRVDHADVRTPSDSWEESYRIEPLVPPVIKRIPPEIQSSRISIGTVIVLSVDAVGRVVTVIRPRGIPDDRVWGWLEPEFEQSIWPPDSGRIMRRIEIPLILDTALCKVEIGGAYTSGVDL
ncbi:TonB family protein [bacterium]|nr:TonB family protein [candidate division CSSED10-310 bacterium]